MNAEQFHDNEEANAILRDLKPIEAASLFILNKWITEAFLASRMKVSVDRIRAWADGSRTMN